MSARFPPGQLELSCGQLPGGHEEAAEVTAKALANTCAGMVTDAAHCISVTPLHRSAKSVLSTPKSHFG